LVSNRTVWRHLVSHQKIRGNAVQLCR
jgi:hypothetical protein